MIVANSHRKTLIILLIIIITIGALLIGLVLVPLFSKAYGQKDEVEEQKMVLEAAKKDIFQANKYNELGNVISENKQLLDDSILVGDSIITYIQQLEKIAEYTGNKIIIQEYTPPKTKKKTPAADDDLGDKKTTESKETAADVKAKDKETAKLNYFQITLEGDYQKYLAFLYELENVNFVFQINNIEIRLKDLPVQAGIDARSVKPETVVESKFIISYSPMKNEK